MSALPKCQYCDPSVAIRRGEYLWQAEPICRECAVSRGLKLPQEPKPKRHLSAVPDAEKWFERMRSVLPLLSKESGITNAVCMCIFSHLKNDLRWAMSQPEIAREVRCTERSVRRAVSRLRKLGIYETYQPGRHLRTEFLFVYQEPPF